MTRPAPMSCPVPIAAAAITDAAMRRIASLSDHIEALAELDESRRLRDLTEERDNLIRLVSRIAAGDIARVKAQGQ